MHILAILTPLMTFLANPIHIDPPRKFFQIFSEKIFCPLFQILTYDVIFTPKMRLFWPFSPKMTYFDQIDPINDIFDQSYVNKPDLHNVSKFFE